MGQPSIVIHKGGKETKYELYVEDYVLSFLKEATGTLELAEFYFYGYREKNGKKYTIYGVGKDKDLDVFDGYSLLEEIGCRLTQAGPIFLVREKDDVYEIKGYEVFYQDNAQMQRYLIEHKKGKAGNSRSREYRTDKTVPKTLPRIAHKSRKSARQANNGTVHESVGKEIPHNAISVQLGVILVALVAIVINSTNSYDKMEQLNQSASEVFFAMENQEAETTDQAGGGQDEIVVERDMPQEDEMQQELLSDRAESDAGREEELLKLAALENQGQAGENGKEGENKEETGESGNAGEDQGQAGESGNEEENKEQLGKNGNMSENRGQSEETNPDKEEGISEGSGVGSQQKNSTGNMENVKQAESEEEEQLEQDAEEEVEALSRNVTRYYEVERGDTLYTISQKIYGDTAHVKKICELNQITNPDNIRYGQKIILP